VYTSLHGTVCLNAYKVGTFTSFIIVVITGQERENQSVMLVSVPLKFNKSLSLAIKMTVKRQCIDWGMNNSVSSYNHTRQESCQLFLSSLNKKLFCSEI